MAEAPQKLRVFISSTVYDLVDVRSELNAHLAAMGVTPVLSDDKLSDFRVQQEMNSIATCLVNVDSCDEFILILDQRYGPKLGRAGFDDVSATHLEYRRAIGSGRPIHVFVRDRLAAEYSIWKKNKRSEAIGLAWIKSEDVGLFQLLDEHANLSAERRGSNWYSTFTNSIDLKAAISRQFEPRILPRRLVEAIQENRFPLLGVDLATTMEIVENAQARGIQGRQIIKYSSTVKNVGGSPAFNCVAYWAENKSARSDPVIMAPGQSILLVFLASDDLAVKRVLIAEYESATGVLVRDTFEIRGHKDGNAFYNAGILKRREFFRSRGPEIQIQEASSREAHGQHLQAD